MSTGTFVLDDIKRKLKVEQAVRGFFHVMDSEELTLEEGLVAWNMFGFSIFQDLYPEATHPEIQQKMIEFSSNLFNSAK
ncbi:MAG: hypothetical protein HQM13_11615 [SAR324 cluster bacterium]|nr:hypothetical protein [SAR324 cluster bacterium]